MIEFRIFGLEDGHYDLELEIKTQDMKCILDCFSPGIVRISGSFNLFGEKLGLDVSVSAVAGLLCDFSNEQYSEEISVDLDLMFRLFDDEIVLLDESIYDRNSYFLKGNKLDITQIVCDELALSVPMKKVLPKYRGKDFTEIFPEYTKSGSGSGDKRKDLANKENKSENDSEEEKENPWGELKKLNFN